MTKQRALTATVESIKNVLTSVDEKGGDAAIVLESHYDVTSKWLSDTFQLCRMKFGEGNNERNIRSNTTKTGGVENGSSDSNWIPCEKSKYVDLTKPSLTEAVQTKPSNDTAEKELDVMALKVEGLRTELRSRGLSTAGVKRVLRNRLLEALEQERFVGNEPIEENLIRENKRKRSLSPQSSCAIPKSDAKETAPISIASAQSSPAENSTVTDDVDVEMEEAGENNGSPEVEVKLKVETKSRSNMTKCSRLISAFESKSSSSAASVGRECKERQSHENLWLSGNNASHSDKSCSSHSAPVVVEEKERKETKPNLLLLKKNDPEPKSLAPERVQANDGNVTEAGASLTNIGAPQNEHLDSASNNKKCHHSSSLKSEKGESIRSMEEKAAPTKGSSRDDKGVRMLSTPAVTLVKEVKKSSGETNPNNKSSSRSTGTKAKEYSEIWKARLAEMRGMSKAGSTKTANENTKAIPSVSTKVILKTTVSAQNEKDKRKQLLAAQMREKTVAMSLKNTTESENKKIPGNSSTVSIQNSVTHSKTSKGLFKAHAPPPTIIQNSAQTGQKTQSMKVVIVPKKTPMDEQRSPMETYEISDRDESESESDDDSYYGDEAKQKKKIPIWAQRSNLVKALENQYFGKPRLDPDEIFGEVQTCNLEAIFDQKKSRYSRRTSSGNWAKDKVTAAEKLTYKREMGFAGK